MVKNSSVYHVTRPCFKHVLLLLIGFDGNLNMNEYSSDCENSIFTFWFTGLFNVTSLSVVCFKMVCLMIHWDGG